MRNPFTTFVAAQEPSADLSKLSGLLEPGSIVQTLSVSGYHKEIQ